MKQPTQGQAIFKWHQALYSSLSYVLQTLYPYLTLYYIFFGNSFIEI